MVSKFPTLCEYSSPFMTFTTTVHVTGINMNMQLGMFLQPNGQQPRHQYQSVLTTNGGMQLPTREPRQIFKTYVSEEQQRMLDAFGDDGEEPNFGALVKTILEIENEKAIKPDCSRLLGLSHAPAVMTNLLWQRSPDEIRSFLRNDIPQQLQGSLLGALRRPAHDYTGDSYDPVIYNNFIVDKDFLGVPTVVYDKLLTAVEMAAFIDVPAHRDFDMIPEVVRDEVKAKYREIRSRYRKLPWIVPGSDFYSEFSHEELKKNALSWVSYNRRIVLPRAKEQQISHIAIPAEAGLSSKGYSRCKVHRYLEPGSPHLFRLVQMILTVMAPRHGFHLEQVYIFDLVQEGQGEIGESMASIISASYVTMGGLNFEQAGLSQSGLTEMNLNHWKQVARNARPGQTLGRLRHVDNNAKLEEAFLAAAIQKEKDAVRELELRVLNQHAEKKLRRSGRKVGTELKAIEEVNDEALDQVKETYDGQESEQQAVKVVSEARSAMDSLLGKLSSLPHRSSAGD